MTNLSRLLQKHRHEFADILPSHLQHGKVYLFDLSSDQSPFRHINPTNTNELIRKTQQLMEQSQADIAISRYNETRLSYQDNPLFENLTERRDHHIGVDLTVPVGTPIYAPLTGKIHSFKNNDAQGDYGPTIILQHQLENTLFFTLYGHLTIDSLKNKSIGQVIKKGGEFAKVGHHNENGRWPPHLHFQIIDDMQSYFGDYPGVVSQADRSAYLQHCPDPNLILNIKYHGN